MKDAPLDPAVAALIEQAREAGVPALSAGSPDDARTLLASGREALGAGPPVRERRELDVPTRAGSVPALLLSPVERPAGLCVYLHGGGWVVGAPADFEAVARALAVRSGWALLLPDYRLAPEHPFPAGLEDCEDALLWAARERSALAGWEAPLVVAGDSAGGNLAAVAAHRAGGRITLAGQVLIYPVTDADFATPSYLRYAAGLPLTREDMVWFFRHYAPEGLWRDPAISSLRAPDLQGSPPAVVALAGHDVLRDEGRAYAERLRKAGKLRDLLCYPSLHHGFIRLHNLVESVDRAVTEIASAIGGFGEVRAPAA